MSKKFLALITRHKNEPFLRQFCLYYINQGIDDLDQASFNIAVATAQVGSEMASVNTQREVNEETVLQLRTILSNLEDLDYSEAVTQMQKDMLALQATQSSFSQISNLNLFNYIS